MNRTPDDQTETFAAILAEVKRDHTALTVQWAEMTAESGDLRAPGSAALDVLIESLPPRERKALRRFHDETLAMATRHETPPAPPPTMLPIRFYATALRA